MVKKVTKTDMTSFHAQYAYRIIPDKGLTSVQSYPSAGNFRFFLSRFPVQWRLGSYNLSSGEDTPSSLVKNLSSHRKPKEKNEPPKCCLRKKLHKQRKIKREIEENRQPSTTPETM